MPKFYRQNKKRIDPRYFLNETINRDEEGLTSEEYDAINGALHRIEMTHTLSDSERDAIMAIGDRITKSEGGRSAQLPGMADVQELTPEQLSALKTAAARGDDALKSAVVSIHSSSGSDADGDGTSDAEELMKIAQGMKNKNYGLASSVMQDDDNIPVSKKIPSGYS